MPLKLPIKVAAPRVKSPASHGSSRPSRLSAPSPTRNSSSRRSRSHEHDRGRRPSDASLHDHPHRSSSGRPRSHHRRSPSPPDRHERRHRRGSSASPDRRHSRRDDDRDHRDSRHHDDPERRHRRLSAVEKGDRDAYAYGDGGRPRRSSVDNRGSSLRPGAAPSAFYHEGEDDPRNRSRDRHRDDDRRHRAATPDKYKPDKYKRSPSPPRAKPAGKPAPAAAASPPSQPNEGSSSSGGAAALFNNMPTAIAAYAGLKTLSKQADTAKEWIDWFTELSDTPEEIQELSEKADAARDTIAQVRQLIRSRPDLLEGDKQGEALQEQIEDAIASTNKALSRMTKLLAEISAKGGANTSDDQDKVTSRMRDFWRSYRYKEEFEEKIATADADVQKELSGLGKLMLNLNTRALMKPAPPAAAAAAAAPSPSPAPAAAPAAVPAPPPVVPAAAKPAAEPVKDEPRPAESKPTSEPLETKQAESTQANKRHDPTRYKQGFREGLHEALVIEGLREPHESKAEKEEDVKRTTEPTTAEGAPKRQETPRFAEGPSPASSSAPSSIEPPSTHEKYAAPGPVPVPAPVLDAGTGCLPPSPSAVAREEAAIGSPPILVTEPTQTSTSSAAAAAAQSPVPSPPPSQDKPKQSPEDDLLDAAWDGNMEGAIKALRQVSPRICDDHGLTPLHLAAERDKMPVSMLLLDRGASIESRSDGGRTPLHLAARSATAPMVEMLLERGKADPNSQTSKGRTALHYAASKAVDGDEERREVLRVLRDWGADPTIRDDEGETARDVAQQREHWDAAATLRRAEKRWEEDHKQGWLQRHGFKK